MAAAAADAALFQRADRCRAAVLRPLERGKHRICLRREQLCILPPQERHLPQAQRCILTLRAEAPGSRASGA